MKHRLALVVLSIALFAVGASSAAPPAYRVTAIPGIPEQGFNTVFPADINNNGVIVGALVRLSGFVPVRAFLWTGSGPTVDLGDLGVFEFSQALGINDAGQVIGVAEVADPRSPTGHDIHGFFWENGTMTDLVPLGADTDCQAVAINELGEVLVDSFDRSGAGRDRYYVWSHGKIDQIGRLNADPGGPSGVAASMNDLRQIVGSVVHADGQERAFLWEKGRMTDLGLAPGDDFFSSANRITNDGRIVGESWAFDSVNTHGSRGQGIVWQGASFVRTVPPLPGDWAASLIGVNGSGTTVGYSGFPSSATVSFGGAAMNLNDLVPGQPPSRFLYQGTDVNERGQIVVDGQFGCCGYLLDPK